MKKEEKSILTDASATKTPRAVRAEIKRLLGQMQALKRSMEHPDYDASEEEYTAALIKLDGLREAVCQAKGELNALGGKYRPSKAEKRCARFEQRLEGISSVTLSFNYLTDLSMDEYAVAFKDGVSVFRFLHRDGNAGRTEDESSSSMSPEDVKALLSSYHIGEWDETYEPSRFGIIITDGVVWKLKVEYSDGKRPFLSRGHNVYPYNFSEVANLLGLDAWAEAEEAPEGEDHNWEE